MNTIIDTKETENSEDITEIANNSESVEKADIIAIVGGKEFIDLPKDLYIPPDALEVILETFEGPLDLLLYLIRRQDLDILNIPIAEITHQYIQYIKLMEAFRLELAAEYLVMAAMLAEIKSRMLLPKPKDASDEEEEDPRAELVRRLQEYERFKTAAHNLNELPWHQRDTYDCKLDKDSVKLVTELPPVSMQDLIHAMLTVMKRADNFAHHHIQQEPLSLRERMTTILDRLSEFAQTNGDQYVEFIEFFDPTEGKMGVVVTVMAVLELCRESLIELMQNQAFAPIYVRSRGL